MAQTRPARLLWLHGHRLSSTVEPWASKRIPAMYERSCQALTWSKPPSRSSSQPALSCNRKICTIVQQVAVHDANLQLESSLLSLSFTLTLQSGSNPSCSFSRLSSAWSTNIQSSWNIWMYSFKIYTKWSAQTSIHKLVHNAVTLVWACSGSSQLQ